MGLRQAVYLVQFFGYMIPAAHGRAVVGRCRKRGPPACSQQSITCP